MSFIGVICETKNENYIKQVLIKKLKNKTIIILTEDNIENFKNIKFETVIIMSNNSKMFSSEINTNSNIEASNEIQKKNKNLADKGKNYIQKNIIKNIIAKSKCLIVNADEQINLNLLQDTSVKVITYGFNSKSTITTSSVKDDNILICVQRNMQDFKNNEIEFQEFNIKIKNPKIPTNIVIGIATVLLLYGIQDFVI